MASIKNLKSKGKAECICVIGDGLSYAYEVRKQQFAALRPAKVVRPLRAVRKVYATALGMWERSVSKSQREGGAPPAYPYDEEVRYRMALVAAAAGKGQLVHRCAS